MKYLITLVCLLTALLASAQFGGFRTDQPFLAAPAASVSGPLDTNGTLILWWQLNEGSGVNIVGLSDLGGATGGTNDAAWVTGKSGSGYALDFTRASSHSASTTNLITFSTNRITVCFWMNLDANNVDQWFISGAKNGSSVRRSWRIFQHGASQTLRVLISDQDGAATDNFSEYVSNSTTATWVHWAIYLSEDIMWFRVNGELLSDTTTQNTLSGSTDFVQDVLYFGSRGDTNMWFGGSMDDIRIYSGELTAQMVTNIMNDPR